MVIDSHQHVILPTEKQLLLMEEAGLDKVILFPTSVHPENAKDLTSFEREMSTLNDIVSGKKNVMAAKIASIEEQVKVIEENPGKFIGFGTVPVGMSDNETLDWIQRRVVSNGYKGMGEFTLASGQTKLLEPIFRADMELGKLPLWIHTFFPLTLEDIKNIDKLSKQFPDIPVILGHFGGSNWLQTIKLAQENPNLYLDISAAFSSLVVSFIIKSLPNRTLFSSDAPHGDPVVMKEMIERVVDDKYVRDRVLGENIAELLKI